METILEIRGLDKSFGKKVVLRDIYYSFSMGIYGLLGANGAGKTTLLRCITRHYKEGYRTIFHRGVALQNSRKFAGSIGYLPQRFGAFSELTVIDSLQLLSLLRGLDKKIYESRIQECLKLVNLDEQADMRTSALSGGMLRRLGIAQALLADPDIIIFDEPTAGLDPEERIRFHNIVRKIHENKLIIISTHIVEDLEAGCDHILMLRDGEIGMEGKTQEVIRTASDRVFIVPETKLGRVKGQYKVTKEFIQDGFPMVRLLTAEPQAFNACTPTLEDAYMRYLHNL